MKETVFRVIARINSEFPTKFGIPRQSGLVEALRATVVFEPAFRNTESLRGLEGYSHIWLLWQFSESVGREWTPTVRPPRLGGNKRMGVFATRLPFRPNPIGLSSVKLEKIEWSSPKGPILLISGADLMDGTPIYDIKPYLAYVDAHPEATGGFAFQSKEGVLRVNLDKALADQLPQKRREALVEVLAQDPRPGYQHDSDRIYHFEFAGMRVAFTVAGDLLTVRELTPS